MFARFLPKTIDFFDLFLRHIRVIIEASNEMVLMTEGKSERGASILRIREFEHQADTIAHECLQALCQTFITPFDRLRIHDLTTELDDIIDAVEDAASRIDLYDISIFRPEAAELAKVVLRAATKLEQALKNLHNLKHIEPINQAVIAVHRLENDGDLVMRSAIKRLFEEETQPLMIIKWKEIFEQLEQATDRCEDVADTIQAVVIEAS